ncbi:MAG: endonuclease III [Bacteroidetes bacterium]|nr:MAG: endonuclease III [Bacteroidota bacterium]
MSRTFTPTQESPQEIQRRAKKITAALAKDYPEAKIALHHSNPLELLISTILSAQCTDARVNIVTESLFKKYKTATDYAIADQHELEKDIHSTGFYRAKAKNIIACCTTLVEQYNGNVPSTMEELLQLAGVGRKTANVVLSGAFGKIEGIVVDTHVGRLAQRLGFTKETNPEKIERDLMTIIPKQKWFLIDNLLIMHGRNICDARKPKCETCSVNKLCPAATT